MQNADVVWSRFDTGDYLARNYLRVSSDDRQVIKLVRDFFTRAFPSGVPVGLSGIDVGTGANLYPALSMLPFCESITLYEYSVSNLKWLGDQAADKWSSWLDIWSGFWSLLQVSPLYAKRVADPRDALALKVEVLPGSVFELGKDERRWDIGTMFFVAESITVKRDEFTSAIHCFLSALRPGAPFFIAFMENSLGYEVGEVKYPAVAVDREDVVESLAGRADGVTVVRINAGKDKFREGYSGMVVAYGRSSGRSGG